MRANETSGRSTYFVIFLLLAATMVLIAFSGIGGDAAPVAVLVALGCLTVAVGSRFSVPPQSPSRGYVVPPSCPLSERPQREARR